MLDIPFNYHKQHYTLAEYIERPAYQLQKTFSEANKLERFLGINFFNLSLDDKNRVKNIENNLIQRGLLNIFEEIMKTSTINDGGFLFEDRAAVFLEKLFEDILPIANHKKLEFFIKVLENQKFKANTLLEDVFEGLNGFYQRLQALLLNLKTQDIASIENSSIDIIRIELKTNNNFKIILGRLSNIFELIVDNGGSIKEQIEYLFNNKNLLTKPQHYLKAKEAGMNIIHQQSDLAEAYTQYKLKDEKELRNSLVDNEDTAAVINSLRYLGSVVPHQRASIDTYIEYFSILSKKDLRLNSNCNAQVLSQDSPLKTIDYVSSNRIASKYTISYSIDELLSKHSDNDSLYTNILIKLESNSYEIYQLSDNHYHKLDKAEINLPASLDSKIIAWQQEGKRIGSIDLFDSEIQNTIFEQDKNTAHKIAMSQLILTGKNNFQQISKDFDNLPKEEAKDYCYAPIGIITDDINLVTGFTTKQAIQNTKLLALNILSSSGKHYDKQYPDQELGAYLSLFNFILSSEKIHEDVERARKNYAIVEDYNFNKLSISENEVEIKPSLTIDQQESKYALIINKFCDIYKKNSEFNFAQIVALGLVGNYLSSDVEKQITTDAKALLQYNGYFTQALRVLLATNITSESSLEELSKRAKLIARNINILNQKISHEGFSVKVHALLTQYGAHPENLVFFAACLAKEKEITADQIIDLVNKVASLDASLKNKLLNSFAKAKLPFAHGEMIESDLPKITLADLADPDSLQQIIEAAKNDQIEYKHATRFNDINFNSMQNAEVDLSKLKDKYNLQLEDNYTYAQLKAALVKNPHFIAETFKTKLNIDLELMTTMFRAIAASEASHQIKEIIKLLYNPAKALSNQYLEIEVNKFNLDEVLSSYSEKSEKEQILSSLSRISHDALTKLLLLLKSLPQEKLQSKGFTISKLVETAGSKIINDHFEAFKIITEKFVNEDIGISLDKAYQLIGKASTANYSSSSIKQIIEYAIENKDYTIVALLAKTNGRADNIAQVINWFCNIPADKIIVLNKALGSNAKEWLTINQVNKIEIIGNIALRLGTKLETTQYKTIIKNIARNDLNHAKLIQSYLVSYSIEKITFDDLVNLVINNLDTPENLQTIFSGSNLARFNYNKERVIDKISKIVFKNTAENIQKNQQEKLLEYFVSIFEKASNYKELNINQIHDKAIELKHNRMLSKAADPADIIELDLEFLSLSFELLYRQLGKFPRDTQILSQLISLLHNESMIEEIATGQGKSITTALFTAYLWFTGQTVDVVTSSQDLAIRDLKEFSDFYDVLGIKHSNQIITSDSLKEEYKKGGINYGTASDIALFRANREFYSNTHEVSLNTDVSLVCDEIDSALTSEVNYKLATSMINANQAEARTLFSYILEFAQSDIFKSNQLDRQDDVKNLETYLHYQLLKYDTSYKYPLNAIQINELKISVEPVANRLYLLHTVLVKADQNRLKLFDKLLDAVAIAKSLENGVDYVILKEDLDNQQTLLKATPIIKDQPARGTSFGEGVQAFLHLLIEEEMPHLVGKFDISAPSSTIFNISPKNFFDYYRLTDGRIIGLTGTAGNEQEIAEFRAINKMLSFNIPRFEEDSRDIKHEIVTSKEEQIARTLDVISSTAGDKPVIIFSENTKSAEEIYAKLLEFRDHVQLYAASLNDTDTIENIVNKAGNNAYLTITTPMLGRGTDFLTNYPDGFLAINLCTHITKTTLWQVYGRVGRNGQKGEIISLFNKEIFGDDIDKHMDSISLAEKEQRMESQSLTDILKFFSKVNSDNPVNAITYNEFIKNAWNNLIENNIEGKNYQDLRADLVEIVKIEYPLGSKKLDDYLQRIDNGVPSIDEFESNIPYISYQVNYVIQQSKSNEITITEDNFQKLLKNNNALNGIARSTIIDQIKIPRTNSSNLRNAHQESLLEINPDILADSIASGADFQLISDKIKHNLYRTFYNTVLDIQAAISATHIFSFAKNSYSIEYNSCCELIDSIPSEVDLLFQGDIIYAKNQQLYVMSREDNPIPLNGLSSPIYQSILNKIQTSNFKLDNIEIYAIKSLLMRDSHYDLSIEGEGSSGNLMLNKFKKSFNSYKGNVNSTEVNKISPLIDNFMNLKDLDLDKLEYGKYQAIDITTRFSSSSSHAESLLIDGNLLFWINRGGDTTNSDSGIKVFKIIKDMQAVKAILKQLQEKTLSQTETRSKIYTMLREDNDQNIPEHVLIPMQAQSIGNCGWTQNKGMLKAAIVAMKAGHLIELPDIESQEWQKAIKDADDIYKDFVNYNIAAQAEEIILTNDPEFKPLFLSDSEQDQVNTRREMLDSLHTTKLIMQNLKDNFNQKADKFTNTIYEKQVSNIRELVDLDIALYSQELKPVAMYDGAEATKTLLSKYQKNKAHDFKQLDSIYQYQNIKKELSKSIIDHLASSNYNIANINDFNNMLSTAIEECSDNENIVECVKQKMIGEMDEVCLVQDLTY